MKKPLLLLPLLSLPLLAGCINDAAAYRIDGREHAISVSREQNFFWEKTVKFAVIAARLPDCQRIHLLDPAPRDTPVELWQPGPGTFILKQGASYFLTETQTCKGFQKLPGAPQEGMGDKLGVFAEKDGILAFAAEPKPEPPPAAAAPAAESGGAEGAAAPAPAEAPAAAPPPAER